MTGLSGRCAASRRKYIWGRNCPGLRFLSFVVVVIRGSWFVIREGGGLTAAEYIWGLWLPIVPAEFFLICAGRPLSHFVTAPHARGAFPLLDGGNCPGNLSSVSPIIYFASLGQTPINLNVWFPAREFPFGIQPLAIIYYPLPIPSHFSHEKAPLQREMLLFLQNQNAALTEPPYFFSMKSLTSLLCRAFMSFCSSGRFSSPARTATILA